MDKTTLDRVTEQTRLLMAAPSCSQEARQAAQDWLDALGTDREAAQTQAYLQELEEDLVTVDELIAFAQSAAGRQVFGPEADNVATHGRALKEASARFCDCPACQAAAAILTETGRLH